MQTRGSKNIDLSRFKRREDDERILEKSLITNSVNLFYKINKFTLWFRKIYETNVIHYDSQPTYEKEASASDFFRFILGKDRAAKYLVAVDADAHSCVISQKNPAGFDNFFKLCDGIRTSSKTFKKAKTISAGIGELEITEKILADLDGLINLMNCGLNSKGELSRIDFEKALSVLDSPEFYDRVIADCVKTNERLVIQSNDKIVINRFYHAMLKIVILNKEVIDVIFSRHYKNASQETKHLLNEFSDFMLAKASVISQQLQKSDSFRNYLRELKFDDIRDEIAEFFKHESKYFPDDYFHCYNAIENDFIQLKRNCLEEQTISLHI